MRVDSILYRDGYKYQLASSCVFLTSIRPAKRIETDFISLDEFGVMCVKGGYAWDGATGTPDNKNNLYPSCGHDALYQLMRLGLLDHKHWPIADNDYCKWLKEKGAWSITVKVSKWALDRAGGKYAHPSQKREVYVA